MISTLIKRLSLTAAIAISITTTGHAEPVTKQAGEVFAKWVEWQMIMPDKDLRTMAEHLDAAQIRQQYVGAIHSLTHLTPLLDKLTGSYITPEGFMLRNPVAIPIKENFSSVYDLMERNMPAFINLLRDAPMYTPTDAVEESNNTESNKIIEKYNALMRLLYAHPDQVEASKYLFTVANRFFEFCFEAQSFPAFQRMMIDIKEQPLGRMLYAVAWYNLAGNGWKHWHEESLKTLKARADAGKTVKYIAGGSDLLQLMRSGIYNIKNIDPQLPSQPVYYANGWEFIVSGADANGGLGDKIVLPFPEGTLTMERTGFVLTGESFKARLNNDTVIEIPRSITTWTITNAEGVKLGEYQLDRRFCVQGDFAPTENETLLMSFNELYFISLPNFLNGWQIEPNKFPEDLDIVIKQLRKPVTRDMIFNMRIASLLNAADFKFIALGTCIN